MNRLPGDFPVINDRSDHIFKLSITIVFLEETLHRCIPVGFIYSVFCIQTGIKNKGNTHRPDLDIIFQLLFKMNSILSRKIHITKNKEGDFCILFQESQCSFTAIEENKPVEYMRIPECLGEHIPVFQVVFNDDDRAVFWHRSDLYINLQIPC